ncbi:bifunctional lysylphosphatidylglycerol flippase/synthetase MprF [Enterococcus sp.]|uniref:bifunctional lysylphosphatidylglycerol flippase/synthetase MprF n=1 Tax=Enterococcus sp. TaxID=35783 RepID=UPI003C72284C
MNSLIHTASEWFKKHSLLLRLLFFGSILIFVANQVMNIAHGMSWTEVKATMDQQGRSTLLIMAVLGLVAVLPMLGYDWVTVKALEKKGKPKMSLGDFFVAAWTTNTINNLAGFGGIVGASLRANFYGKGIDRKQVLAMVSKVALFMVSGLSLWALILAVQIFGFGWHPEFRSYWIWLTIGSLLAPGLLGLAYLRRKKLFADLFPKGVLQLMVTSFCQWSGALAIFLAIGGLMGLKFAVTDVYPMFLIATLIGMLTMVPGGMGTFDVMMILGMSGLGFSQNQTVVWLLYYRLFYYLVPFISGLVIFLTQSSVRLNRFFDNLPRILLQKVAHMVVIVAVYFAGIMMVLLSTVKNLSAINQIFKFLLPFSFDFLDQTLNLLVGFLLLGLARGLYAKVKKAYLPTIVVLVFGILNTISRTRSIRLLVVYCLVLLAVWLARNEFYREKFVYSWGAMIFDSLLFGTLLIVYAVAGFHRGQWWNNQVLGNFVLFPSEDVWFAGLIGLGLSLLVLFGLQQYLYQPEKKVGVPFESHRFEALLARYEGNKNSHRLRLPGYQLYYYQEAGEDKVVFGFQIKANRCFVLGNPIGDPALFGKATRAFLKDTDLLGYQLAFYKISESCVVMLHDLGFEFTKIGETGAVDFASGLPDFTQMDSYRKTSTQGFRFTYYRQLPVALVSDLERVSDQWLAGQREKFFASGRFDVDYLLANPVGVVRDQQNKIIGFITQQAINQEWVSYDLLRVADGVDQDVANYLVLNMMLQWQKDGFHYADMGMAPLAHVGDAPSSFFQERVMNVIFNYGNAFYEFQENYQGKKPFASFWDSCYFAYEKRSSFYLAAGQLLQLMGRGRSKGPTLVEEALEEEAEMK